MVFIVILDHGIAEEIKGVFTSKEGARAFVAGQPATHGNLMAPCEGDDFYRIVAHEVKS